MCEMALPKGKKQKEKYKIDVPFVLKEDCARLC